MKEQVEKKIDYFPNGKVDYEYHLNKKGQWHGSYKSFDSEGSVIFQTEFKNDQRNGLLKGKRINGSFSSINTQNKDEIFGLMIRFENKINI